MDSIFILFCFRCNQHNNETRVHQEVYFMLAPHTSRRFLSGKVVFYPFHDPVSSLTKKEVFSFMSIPQTSVRLRVMLENVPPFSLQSCTNRQTGFCWKWAGKVRKKYQSMQRELLAHILKKTPKKTTQLSSQTQMSKTSHPLLPLQQLFQLQLSSLITFPYLSPVTVPSPAHQPPKFPHPKNTLASPSLPHASFPPQPAFSPLPS